MRKRMGNGDTMDISCGMERSVKNGNERVQIAIWINHPMEIPVDLKWVMECVELQFRAELNHTLLPIKIKK